MTAAAAPELSIVIPTYNERGNLHELISRLRSALHGVAWEAILVDDDSPDGTSRAARELAREEPRVRCMRRIGRRGLSSACVEGMLSCSSPFIAVMDADLQHDPALLRRMLEVMRAGETDIVVGSRYVEGGGVGDWDSTRVRISQVATRLSALVMKAPVRDPMSGYFMLRQDVIEDCAPRLSSLGFKILLDIVSSVPPGTRVRELPFVFGQRHAGDSKLSSNVVWEYLLLLADKMFGKYVPVRFVAFAVIGSVGVLVHFLVLSIAFNPFGVGFTAAQTVATVAAMVFNYSVNNVLTYSGFTLKGAAWFKGLLSFMVVCSIGAVANVGAATYLFGRATSWPLAALAGVVLGAVWNYAVSARYTWRAK